MSNETVEQLTKELAEARQRIAEVEAELDVCYEKQENFNRALTQDLRGGLGLIVSFTQVLDEYHDRLTGEEVRNYLKIVGRKGHRTIAVIEGIRLRIIA